MLGRRRAGHPGAGADADPGLAEAVAAARSSVTAPSVEVVVIDGGQPRYPLLIGVE